MIFGGLIPVIAFTVVEEKWGTLWGLILGMAFGLGEIIFELVRTRSVSMITWVGNGLLLVLGAVSLLTSEGIWFKLQPALIEIGMGAFLIGSVLVGKPLMVVMAKKQGTLAQVPPHIAPVMEAAFSGLTFRLGVFFLLNAILASYAAFYWSTEAWAILKGVGFTVGLFLYLGVEILLMRGRTRRQAQAMPAPAASVSHPTEKL
ncbi:MAG: septation protein IspZ [Deltaproteobacteria bacterium]|nr:septation protein IspZ [Deltaproteobacteria bacterium]MBI3296182.1 septation protein IspZ [Deltaproteobacteria bacterium]